MVTSVSVKIHSSDLKSAVTFEFSLFQIGNDDAFFSEFLESFNPANPESAFFNSEMAQQQQQQPPAGCFAPNMMMMNQQQPSYMTNNNMSFGACAMPMNVAPMVSTMNILKKPMTTTTFATAAPTVATAVAATNKPVAVSAHKHESKNKRLKKRRRRAFSNDDPRRSYVDAIFGSINGGDGVLSTLERIAHPNVMMTCRFLGDPSTITTGKLYREVKGREQIAKFIDSMLMASPDAILKLHEKKMRLRQNNSSYIVAKYTLEGYKFCNVLTTNDRIMTKKINQLPCLKSAPAVANTPAMVAMNVAAGSGSPFSHQSGQTSKDSGDVAVMPTLFTHSGSSGNSLHSDSEGDDDDEDDEGEEWNDEHFFDDLASVDMDAAAAATNTDSFLQANTVEKSIQERSQLLVQASQFMNRQNITSIHGYDEKISIASSNTEFGLSESLSIPILVSTIGTMALHINPNRQIYKIEFLWTYNQHQMNAANKRSSLSSSIVADEIRMIHN